MPLLTIVEAYIFAALKRAAVETLPDGTLVATIPALPGLIAYGADQHECARTLYGLIEETVRTWLAKGYEVPVLDGIDLNAEKGYVLASYHRPVTVSSGYEIYEDESALERAFEAHGYGLS